MPKINETFVKKCALPERDHKIYYDDDVRGFGLRVTKSGARSFVLNYHVNGRERRMTIGRHPDWTAKAAREEAKVKKRAVDRGEDPLGERIEARKAPTVGDMWLEFKRTQLSEKSSSYQGELIGIWEGRIIPKFKNVKLKDLSARQIEQLHRDITNEGHPVRANRVVGSLRTLLNRAKQDGHIASNPAERCRLNKEHPKERYLSGEELARAIKALAELPNQNSANAIRLLILTGARRSEVLGARWAEFDLQAGVWLKPAARVKDRKSKRVPLSNVALDLLKKMRQSTNGEYLFSSPNGDGHIKSVKRSWARLKELADLEGVRIHDLRHTFASHAISNGHSLATIGGLLGHSQMQTTMRYAHLFDEPMRAAAESVGEISHSEVR